MDISVGSRIKVKSTGEIFEVFDITPEGYWVDKGVGEMPIYFFGFDEVERDYWAEDCF